MTFPQVKRRRKNFRSIFSRKYNIEHARSCSELTAIVSTYVETDCLSSYPPTSDYTADMSASQDICKAITQQDICIAAAITQADICLVTAITQADICKATAITLEDICIVTAITQADICSVTAITQADICKAAAITQEDICVATVITVLRG